MKRDHGSFDGFMSVLLVSATCLTFGCAKPAPVAVELAPVPEGKYRVRENDMLSSIAQREYGNGNLYFVLLNANPELKSRPKFTLYAGEVINLPKKDQIDKSTPKSVFPEKLPGKYVILPGDSLRFIAKRCYGDAELWKTIYEANKDVIHEKALKNPQDLIAGQQITIPAHPQGSGAETAAAESDTKDQ